MADLGLIARLTDGEERRAVWRRFIVSLGEEDGGPSPLEGLPAEEIAAGVRAALTTGLVDDLDFVDAPRAGAALYALASALPLSVEQRELGRRVLSRISSGDAHAFVAIATSMALTGGKPFQTAAVRSRMMLVSEMPLSQGLRDGRLALALVGRRQLARDWVVAPSMGSLPARRLSARLIERAACEAARHASRGDPHAMRALSGEAVSGAMARLLADRESLVWRHVAIARGVLAPFTEGGLERLDHDVQPNLSPTEWRRAATAIGALVGVDPEAGAARAHALLHGPVFARDRGVSAAILWGCTRALELEPDAARTVMADAARAAPLEAAEAMSELLLEWAGSDVGHEAARAILEALSQTDDDEARAIALHLEADLAFRPGESSHDAVRHRVAAALVAFGAHSVQAAASRARTCVDAASDTLAFLRQATDGDPAGRRGVLGALRDLDVAMLQGTALVELVRLEEKLEEGLDQLREELADWLLARPNEGARIVVDLRALRTLVHLVDSDLGEEGEGGRATRLRKRWGRIAAAVLARFEASPPQALRRATSAALARAVDALVRADAIDPVDAVLACGRSVTDVARFEVVSEASMDPGVRHAMARYGEYLEHPTSIEAMEAWARDLVPDPSSRAETLRRVLHRLTAALRRVLGATSLRDLASTHGTEADVVLAFEAAVEQLARMTRGARGRLGPEAAPTKGSRHVAGNVAVEVARVLSGAQREVAQAPLDALRGRAEALPAAVGAQCLRAIEHIAGLPADMAETTPSRRFDAMGPDALPSWLPPRRTLGGFFVERRLGSGGGGSVFVAQRVEDRGAPDAQHFALKVPDYSAAAARTLSETEFLQMFRSEASALIALPHHPNLANFITFDSGSRPKPILVMELVDGATLEHVIEARALEMSRALAILDDVLAGLEAMHAVGVGHLDVKPSNVLLRARGGKPGQAVLVDFGLAGRHVRPGCATGAYGAPEVWVPPEKGQTSPLPVDVYAFGCLAYEALTARVLFAAQDEVAQIGVHLAHDGSPDPIRAMSQRAEHAALAELIFSTLRRDPHKRPVIGEVRSTLQRLGRDLGRLRWPLDGASSRR